MKDDSDQERRFDVPWGNAKATVVLHRAEEQAGPEEWWVGGFGCVTVRETLRADGHLMVIAEVPYPEEMYPQDGYEHTLSGEWQDDVRSAVVALHIRLTHVCEWARSVAVDATVPPRSTE